MNFEIISDISNIETIATARAIKEIKRLRKIYGSGRWRKLKGIETIRLSGGIIFVAEIHWYEAHGIGKSEFKIKRLIKVNNE